MDKHAHSRWVLRWGPCALLCVAAAGCMADDAKPTGPPRGGQIGDVVVLMSPHAVNWDDDPAYDGLSLFVLFFSAGRGEAIAVDGTLTFHLYSGSKRAPGSKPIREWVFSSDQLEQHLGRSTYGWGYGFRLDWKDKVPTTRTVILAGELRTADGHVHRCRDCVVRTGVRR